MAIQSSTFKSLPPKEEILRGIEDQKAHLADLSSYMWHIMPVAERFGDKVYDVAAAFLATHGFDVTASRLRELAEELETPEGMQRYADRRRSHMAGLFGGGSGPPEDDSA